MNNYENKCSEEYEDGNCWGCQWEWQENKRLYVKSGDRFVIVQQGLKIYRYDFPNGLNFDSTAFDARKSYAVADDFDSAHVATVNIAESDADVTYATSVGVADV